MAQAVANGNSLIRSFRHSASGGLSQTVCQQQLWRREGRIRRDAPAQLPFRLWKSNKHICHATDPTQRPNQKPNEAQPAAVQLSYLQPVQGFRLSIVYMEDIQLASLAATLRLRARDGSAHTGGSWETHDGWCVMLHRVGLFLRMNTHKTTPASCAAAFAMQEIFSYCDLTTLMFKPWFANTGTSTFFFSSSQRSSDRSGLPSLPSLGSLQLWLCDIFSYRTSGLQGVFSRSCKITRVCDVVQTRLQKRSTPSSSRISPLIAMRRASRAETLSGASSCLVLYTDLPVYGPAGWPSRTGTGDRDIVRDHQSSLLVLLET